MRIPIFINVRDYGSPAAAMVRRLLLIPEARPIVVDNASTWMPWLEWLDQAPCETVKLSENRGPRAALTIMQHYADAPYYCLTDGDLDLSDVPGDFLDVLRKGLDRWPSIGKVGLSLELSDIPEDYPFRQRVLDHESQFWRRAILAGSNKGAQYPGFFKADIETTFAMHRTGQPYAQYGPALRADRPYTARHLPWYFTPANVTPEYLHYLKHSEFGSGIYWTTLAKDGGIFA